MENLEIIFLFIPLIVAFSIRLLGPGNRKLLNMVVGLIIGGISIFHIVKFLTFDGAVEVEIVQMFKIRNFSVPLSFLLDRVSIFYTVILDLCFVFIFFSTYPRSEENNFHKEYFYYYLVIYSSVLMMLSAANILTWCLAFSLLLFITTTSKLKNNDFDLRDIIYKKIGLVFILVGWITIASNYQMLTFLDYANLSMLESITQDYLLFFLMILILIGFAFLSIVPLIDFGEKKKNDFDRLQFIVKIFCFSLLWLRMMPLVKYFDVISDFILLWTLFWIAIILIRILYYPSIFQLMIKIRKIQILLIFAIFLGGSKYDMLEYIMISPLFYLMMHSMLKAGARSKGPSRTISSWWQTSPLLCSLFIFLISSFLSVPFSPLLLSLANIFIDDHFSIYYFLKISAVLLIFVLQCVLLIKVLFSSNSSATNNLAESHLVGNIFLKIFLPVMILFSLVSTYSFIFAPDYLISEFSVRSLFANSKSLTTNFHMLELSGLMIFWAITFSLFLWFTLKNKSSKINFNQYFIYRRAKMLLFVDIDYKLKLEKGFTNFSERILEILDFLNNAVVNFMIKLGTDLCFHFSGMIKNNILLSINSFFVQVIVMLTLFFLLIFNLIHI